MASVYECEKRFLEGGGGAARRKAHFLLGAVQSEMTNWSWMWSY